MGNDKAVLYCRVAYADEWAIKNQADMLSSFAESNGYSVGECYCDNGESGRTLDRPAMNRLLSDIQGGTFKTVIVKDALRIARDFFMLDQFLDEARKHGVTVISANNDLDGRTVLRD